MRRPHARGDNRCIGANLARPDAIEDIRDGRRATPRRQQQE